MPGKVVDPNYIFTTYTENLSFRAAQGLAPRTVTDHGPLHVSLAWGSGLGSMHTDLVRGQAYMTMHYDGLTPRIGTVHAITGLNGGSASQSVTDSRFEVQLNNGQTWVLYASSPITLSLSGGPQASAPRSLRAALLDVAGESTLDAHAGRIPTGGTVGATAQSDVGTITFDWETTGAGPLLMMALPHHLDVLQGASTTGVVRNTIKGDMVGISGLTWTMGAADHWLRGAPGHCFGPRAKRPNGLVRGRQLRRHSRRPLLRRQQFSALSAWLHRGRAQRAHPRRSTERRWAMPCRTGWPDRTGIPRVRPELGRTGHPIGPQQSGGGVRAGSTTTTTSTTDTGSMLLRPWPRTTPVGWPSGAMR